MSTQSTIKQIVKIKSYRLSSVLKRLEFLKARKIKNIASVLNYGLLPTQELLIEHEFCSGVRLSGALTKLGADQKLIFKELLLKGLEQWTGLGFVHGDLSLRNILVDFSNLEPKIFCIDWLFDLDESRGTPQYAHPELFTGAQHTKLHDQYAVDKILKVLEI